MGDVLGTPSYMAPEQARGNGEAGVPADVYSLGGILYELLTGVPPFRGETAIATLLLVGTTDVVPPVEVNPGLCPDLNAICLKCLSKAPKDRYVSAAELAGDLQRFLDFKPVRARPVGMGTHFLKWVWRKPTHAMLLLMVLVIGLVSLGEQLFSGKPVVGKEESPAVEKPSVDVVDRPPPQLKVIPEPKQTVSIVVPKSEVTPNQEILRILETERDGALESNRILEAQRESARQALAEGEKQHRAVERSLELARRLDYARQLAEVDGLRRHDPERAGRMLQDVSRCPLDLRDFTWGLLVRACDPPRTSYRVHAGDVLGFSIARDARTLSATTTDGFLRIYDYESGKELQNHSIQQTGQLSATAFDLANQKIATGSSDGSVEIRDFQGKSLCRYSGHNRPIYALAFGVRHSELAFAGEHGAINRLEIASKKSIAVGDHRSTVYALAFLKSEKTLLSAGDDGLIKFWHWDDKAKSYKLSANPLVHPGRIYALAFAKDEKILASASMDGTIRLWDLRTNRLINILIGHTGPVYQLAFSHDGKLLASGGEETVQSSLQLFGSVRVWDTITGESLAKLPYPAPVVSVGFSTDDTQIIAATKKTIEARPASITLEKKTIDAGPQCLPMTLAENSWPVRHLVRSSNSRFLLTTRNGVPSHSSSIIVVRDATTGQERCRILPGTAPITRMAFSPDGRTGASLDSQGDIQLWDTLTGAIKPITFPRQSIAATALAFSGDGKVLILAGRDRNLRILAVETGKQRALIRGTGGPVITLVPTADGTRFATGGLDGSVFVCDSATGKVSLVGQHHGAVRAMAFGPGNKLASGAGRSTISIQAGMGN